MKNILFIVNSILTSLALFIFKINPALAITLPSRPSNLPDVSVDKLIQEAIRIIFAVGEIAFIIVLLVGGVMFITSGGNEAQSEKAKKLLTFAIIGIIVLLSAYAIAGFIIKRFV